VYKTSLDMGALASSEAFQAYMRKVLEQTASTNGMSEKDIQQALSIVQSLYTGLVIEATQSIGLDDHYTHQVTVSVNWPLDLSAMTSALGTTSTKMPPLNIMVSLEANLSQFNSAPAIAAPEDARIIPLNQLGNMTNSLNPLGTLP
jgi:hypothetical protein